MKLIYITSYTFPSTRAEPYYLKSTAEAYAKNLGKDFTFVIRGKIPESFFSMNPISISMTERFRTFKYFFWFPFFVLNKAFNESDVIFMSNDPYLLSIFVFWRKIFFFKYRICSDWHQLFEDWKDKYVAQGSDYLITTTKKLQGLLAIAGEVSKEKILVAYGGIDLPLFDKMALTSKNELRKRLKLPLSGYLVGYMGGFRSVGLEKGLDTMIRALPFLDTNTYLVFVGGARQHIDEYRKLAIELNVEKQCLFIGKQQFDKVIEYELAMDILAIPYPDRSHFRNYGFPLKVWEYLASGRPIVYSNLEIIKEVLGAKGIVFEPGNAESFADAVLHIKKEKIALEEKAKQNRKFVESFTWDARASRILEYMESKKV